MKNNRKNTTSYGVEKNFGTLTSKRFAILISAVVLLTLVFTFILTGCNGCAEDPSGATPDTAPSIELNIDEENYTFSKGVFIGSTSLEGKTFAQAREIASGVAESLIKDFTLTVSVDKDKYDYKNSDFTYSNNIEQLLMEAVSFNDTLPTDSTEEKAFDVTVSVDETSVEEIVAELSKKIDKEPVNASIGDAKNNEVSYVKDCVGQKLDRNDLEKKIIKSVNKLLTGSKTKDTVKAKVESIQPSLTYDDISGKIQLLSSFTTYSTNTEDGNHNMATALAACNGSVIAPGEIWSFNECTGNSNLTSLGYRYATVIVGGELVPGVGGGLCQASTTIYNAAIRTNMEVVERYCHYYQSAYASAGLDATIDYPNLDLKLKNTTEYPMYFQCYMSGVTLYCNIYGYQDPSFDEVQIDSYIYDANRKENYYRAAASRTFLKDGEVIYTENLPSSTYHYVAPGEEVTESTAETQETTAPQKPTKPTKPTKPSKPVETTVPDTQTPTTPVVDPVEPTVPITDPTEPANPNPIEPPTNKVEY